MESPLWINTHAPDLGELPQESLREYLQKATAGPINLVLHGPAGSGKTAAVRALAEEIHDDTDNDLIEINVADFFDRTKSEIRDDPRFGRFLQGQTEFSKQYRDGTEKTNKYKRDWSKRDMVTHVVKEMAGYKPSSGEFKTMVLDNAEGIREDFQHALRRVMERRHETTQFVITTRQPAKLIPAIRSRCFPVPVRSPTNEEICEVLETVLAAEEVPYEDAGVEYVASHADGNLRAAITDAQTVAETAEEFSREAAFETLREVGPDDRIESMLQHAKAGEFSDARSELDDLLVDDGYSGEEVLDAIVRVARSRGTVDDARLSTLAGEIDFDLTTGTNDRLHVSHLLATLEADRAGIDENERA